MQLSGTAFCSADGEMLLLPQQNSVKLVTEFGIIIEGPGEILVVPKGVKFRVDLVEGPVRGYRCKT
ncbi:MAG: homogentisate 1,2-dioxygenase [Alphaproteobacteria bacterium]